MILRILLLLLLLQFSQFLLAQQEYHVSVNHYDMEDGLSHSQVHWTYQDSRGMLWIGTANGINRYDGNEFKLVAELDFIYIANHIIEDEEGDLWLRTKYWESELIFFNIYTEQVKSFEEKFKDNPPPFNKDDFMTAASLANGTILIGTKQGNIIHYEQEQGYKQLYKLEEPIAQFIPLEESMGFWVNAGCVTQNCISETGIQGTSELYFFKYLQKGQIEQQIKYDLSGFKYTVSPHIRPLGITKEKSLLLFDDFITEGKEIYIYEFQTDGSTNILDTKLTANSKAMVNLAYDRDEHHFYLCKDGEVYIYSKEGKQLFKSNTYKSLINSHNNYSIYQNGVIWIGCSPGLAKVQVKPNSFKKTAFRDPEFYSSAEFESCRALYPNFQEVWTVHPYYANEQHTDDFWVSYFDKNQRLWIGDFTGVYYLDEGEIRRKLQSTQSHFDQQLNSRVYQFYKDREDQLWIVSANGLFQFDIQKGLTARYSKDNPDSFLPVEDLRHMYQDEDGIYWIGSREGLIRWDKKKDQYKVYTTKDGLSNNHIMAVYEDDFGFIWMTSDNGLMQFQKSSEGVKVYLPVDGISHREFNRTSHFRDSTGNLYFGSLNGVTHFHPKDFVEKFNEQPDIPLVLTECNLVSGSSNQQESRLTPFFEKEKIVLYPGDHNLQLKFSLLDYLNNNPKVIQYVYNINGEQNWNIGNDNSININSLPFGDHLIQIKARTGNGLFSKRVLDIPVTVLRPFYLQWWFLALVISAFISLLYLLQKIKTRVYLKRQAILEKTVKERTQVIQQQAEELKELDQAKSRFLANISHEFRTPLTLILNTLKTEEVDLLSTYISEEEKLSFDKIEVDMLRRNAKRLQQLIDQLLDLAKLESQKMFLKEAPGDFQFYLNELIRSFIPLANQKGIDLQFEADLKNSMLNFDRDKVDKIIYNLLSNAIKFTPADGDIIVRLYRKNKHTIIEVKDSGIGISQGDQARIYDRFYQVNKENDFTYEGTGLGLALVKELVDVYQGEINLESEKGIGSTFTIKLPLSLATPAAIPTEEISSTVSTTASISNADQVTESTNSETLQTETDLPVLLIIEDNKDLLYHHKKSFEDKFQLHLAQDGISGLELAFEKIPDIIICDVMMPGKNGYEVCQELKSDERTNHIPIIMLTAKAGKEERINALESGANAHVTKPYSQKELELRISNLLQQRLQSQQQYQEGAIVKPEKIITPESVFLDKCYAIIEEQINNRNFGVDSLSAELGISRTNLFRKIKSITGTTPTYFIRTYRLEKAKELLSVFVGNATEVSYMVGFNNPNYFFKCFKDQYGITVGQFMETLKPDEINS